MDLPFIGSLPRGIKGNTPSELKMPIDLSPLTDQTLGKPMSWGSLAGGGWGENRGARGATFPASAGMPPVKRPGCTEGRPGCRRGNKLDFLNSLAADGKGPGTVAPRRGLGGSFAEGGHGPRKSGPRPTLPTCAPGGPDAAGGTGWGAVSQGQPFVAGHESAGRRARVQGPPAEGEGRLTLS